MHGGGGGHALQGDVHGRGGGMHARGSCMAGGMHSGGVHGMGHAW